MLRDSIQEREEGIAAGVDVRRETAARSSVYRERYRDAISREFDAGTISRQSVEEWMSWIQESSDTEVERSYQSYLPQYLEERKPLRGEREKLLHDQRLSSVTDPAIRADITILRSEDFSALDISARWKIVDRVRSALAKEDGGETYRELYSLAEQKLKDATLPPQPALHRDKVGGWLKHIFEGYAKERNWTTKQLEAFIKGSGNGTLSGFIADWRSVGVTFWTVRDDPAFEGVRTGFVNTKGFLLKPYEDRKRYVSKMKADRDEVRSLRSRAASLLQSFSAALDSRGPRRWMEEYLFNGNSTLGELKGIVGDELPKRLYAKLNVVSRYKDAFQQLEQKGMGRQVLPFSVFLSLKYPEQERRVTDLERMAGVTSNRNTFLHIRHHMELQEWEDAEAELRKLRGAGNLTEDEARELLSMEIIVKKQLGSEPRGVQGKQERTKQGANVLKELRDLVDAAPSAFQSIYIRLLTLGNAYVHAYRWVWYNRIWCYDHKYLNPEIEEMSLRRGQRETHWRHEVGYERQGREVLHSDIKGRTADDPYVDSCKYAPTNVHVDYSDQGSVSALLEWLRVNVNDSRTLYWTNVLPRVGGTFLSLASHREELARLTKMRSLSRKLEQMGLGFSLVGPAPSLN